MTTTLKTTNARIDSAEQSIEENGRRIEALEAQVPDAIMVSLRELAEKEAKQRIGTFWNVLNKITKELMAKHFPETRKHDWNGIYPAGITIAFPGVYVGRYSKFEITAQNGVEHWGEEELRTKLIELLFQQRIQRLIQATDPAKKETD